MPFLTTAALIAALAAAGVGTTYGLGQITEKHSKSKVNKKVSKMANNPELLELQSNGLWNSLTLSQREALLNKYVEEDNDFNTLYGLLGDEYSLDTDRLLSDLTSSQQMFEDYAALGDVPIYEDYLNSAREQIASENEEMYADLDRLLETNVGMYNDQLRDLSKDYSTARANLLSQQYQQNAQLMDTLQSNMDRSRRNALEAGASAGIRIADNINTLLSVQNKQSATSMETANQLSQMMINQRNAENAVRSRYADTLAEDTSNRHGIKLGSEQRATSLADTNYNSAYNAYSQKESKLDNKYGMDNPLYDYKDHFKPKYSNTNSQ